MEIKTFNEVMSISIGLGILKNDIIKLNINLNKHGWNHSSGVILNNKDIIIFGNSKNTKKNIITLNHEINHSITFKIMRESGLDCYNGFEIYEMERINRIMTGQNEKIHQKIQKVLKYIGW